MPQALVLVDIQYDYFPGGAMELVGMEIAAARAARVLKRFRQAGSPVFHIQHISNRPGATFFLPDTPGAEIHKVVAPVQGEVLVSKHFPNSFRQTGLQDDLRDAGVDQLVICGAMSHMCIDATARAAFDLGYGCTVIEDACATRDLVHRGETISARQVHAAFMAALAVPYARIGTSSDFHAPMRG